MGDCREFRLFRRAEGYEVFELYISLCICWGAVCLHGFGLFCVRRPANLFPLS